MFHNLSAWNAARNLFSSLDSAYIDSNYLHVHSQCAYFRSGARIFRSLTQQVKANVDENSDLTKKKIRSLQRHKICLLVVWNVRDYNVYDALYAYGLHTFAFAYVFVIMLKNIESHFQRAALSICSCLPNHLHSNEDCAFSMGNCIERPEMRNEQNTFALFKNGQILVHIHVHCFGFSSAAVHRRTKHSSFSISRRNSDAFAWLKSIFAFSSMLLPHTLSLRSPFVSRSKFGGLCKWFWLCHSVWQFDLYSFWKSFSFACMFACLFVYNLSGK